MSLSLTFRLFSNFSTKVTNLDQRICLLFFSDLRFFSDFQSFKNLFFWFNADSYLFGEVSKSSKLLQYESKNILILLPYQSWSSWPAHLPPHPAIIFTPPSPPEPSDTPEPKAPRKYFTVYYKYQHLVYFVLISLKWNQIDFKTRMLNEKQSAVTGVLCLKGLLMFTYNICRSWNHVTQNMTGRNCKYKDSTLQCFIACICLSEIC